MKTKFLACLIVVVNFSGLFAHEEPAKTRKEKDKKEQDRLEILQNKISSFMVWKYEIRDNEPDSASKEQYLKILYDPNGNISEMQIYKNSDTLDYRVVFGYDENNNMTTDTDYDPDGAVSESIEYKYDGMGRVVSQLNYEGEGEVDSKFTYETDNNSNTLTLNKYKPLDSIEYQVIYKYEGSVDRGNNIEIIKQKSNGELIMRVENVFDENNTRLQKKIFDENNQLMYYFEYTYFRDSDKFSTISKFSPDEQLISKTTYSLNDSGLTEYVKTIDANGTVLSFSCYEYE